MGNISINMNIRIVSSVQRNIKQKTQVYIYWMLPASQLGGSKTFPLPMTVVVLSKRCLHTSTKYIFGFFEAAVVGPFLVRPRGLCYERRQSRHEYI